MTSGTTRVGERRVKSDLPAGVRMTFRRRAYGSFRDFRDCIASNFRGSIIVECSAEALENSPKGASRGSRIPSSLRWNSHHILGKRQTILASILIKPIRTHSALPFHISPASINMYRCFRASLGCTKVLVSGKHPNSAEILQ